MKRPHTYNGGTDKERTEESIRNYYKEWKEIMDLCVSNPSVVVCMTSVWVKVVVS